MATEEEAPEHDHELEGLNIEDYGEEEEFVITEQLDEETQNLAAGLASRQSDELIHALQEMLKVLEVPKRGGAVLRQYVLASPKCTELLSAWELGSGAPSAVPLMLVLSELFRHPQGLGGGVASRQKSSKALFVVQSRLDKLARTIGRSKMKDFYSHLSSKQRSRQKAALKLLSSIVLRGKLLAVDVATNFDFTLEALKKLAQHPFKAPGNEKSEKSLHQSTRFFFIEFALSFLVSGDPGLLRWILQKRPLYAGVLHGLAKDGEATIIQVLRVFQEKVMAPSSLVPAGLQSVLFGDAALDQLARIAGDELFGESADVAHETLIALCTEPSHGLCPEYASPWESVNVKAGAHGGNQGRLLRLLLRLRVTEAFRHRELLLTTARIRPRLAAAYLDAVPYSLEPRPSPTWFTMMTLVADLVRITSTPPPFASMALQGLPIPAADGPLVRNNLRHLLPRALTKVALNRGLQHADVLVKHASLRLLMEALLSLEALLNEAFAAAESTCSTGNTSESTWMGEEKGTDANLDEALRAQEQGFKRRQWLGLVECIQDTMRATLPDPNILLLINSTISTKDGSHKRSQPVVEARGGKRRKKDDGYAVEEADYNSALESEADEDEETSNALQTLVQIWGSEVTASAEGLTQSLLHAKVLELLAAYQRVLPVAFADKGFDPFKLLPSDPIALSLAQQKAFLSLLLATTDPPRNVSHSTYRLGEGGYMYKHVKPLLKVMIGSSVDHIRDSTHLLATRIMVSTGAFESYTSEPNLWLDHLLRLEGKSMVTESNAENSQRELVLGEAVVGFLAEAVGSVGRTLYKYFDQLFSLLSAHSLGEGSSEHSNILSGSVALGFGPFVVCALEHTLRVVRSDSKSLTQSQRCAISLYVAGVLNDMLRTQIDSRVLGVVITSLLSPEFHDAPGKDIPTLGSEWAPLQLLYQHAQSYLQDEVIVQTPATQMPSLIVTEPSGLLSDVIRACKKGSEDDIGRLTAELVSTLACAPLQEIKSSFFQLVEVVSKICGPSTPLLVTLCGLDSRLLTEVDLEVKKSKDNATAREVLVADVLSAFSSNSSSSLKRHALSIYNFLKALPFSVLFPAIIYGSKEKTWTFELLLAALNKSYSTILPRDQLDILRMILGFIQHLASAPLDISNKKHRLDICFANLKRLVISPSFNNDTTSKELLLCKDMVTKSLAHSVIAGFCLYSTAMEARCSRLLDEYIMDYLKFLLETCSALESQRKAESVAELLGSLRETTFQACKPFVQQALKLFLLKLEGRIRGDTDFQVVHSFILELAGYADPQHYLSFLSDLLSRKNGPTVFLEFAQIFYETWQKGSCNFRSSGPLLQKTLVDVYEDVVNEVLKAGTENGDRCLLAALVTSTSASEVGCSSSTSLFSLLVSITPIEVTKYCIQHPTLVRSKIARILVQASSIHRAEFGRLLYKGTGGDTLKEGDIPLQLASSFLKETELQTEKFCLSDDDLLLLLPAAKVFLCKDHSNLMLKVVVYVGSTYLRLLTSGFKKWGEFVRKLELRLDLAKLPNGTLRVAELSGSYFSDLLALMKRCLAICPLNITKLVSLERKLLPFTDLGVDCFLGTEADLNALFFQVYGKVSVVKMILSAIETQEPEELNSAAKQQKQLSSMVGFATDFASTLTLLFKLSARMKKKPTSSCSPGLFQVIEALEEYLLLELLEVIESVDTTVAEEAIIPLFESCAKTFFRYKFGMVEGMKVLRAFAMRLVNITDDHKTKRIEVASSVLELLLSHSQFLLYIVSCSAAARPLPMNLGRQAGKGTVLSSLPSILSLIPSPGFSGGEQNSGMEVTSVSESENLKTGDGADEVPEASQLALLELLRSLFHLKMHPDVGTLSSEDKATIGELLSLLLAAYGATTNRIDTEIYALMCELEVYGGTEFPGLASMDYLWGEAALKRRKAKSEEKSQSIEEDMETDENMLEARKRTFKEDLAIDPRRCGLSVLCFPRVAQHAISPGIPDIGSKAKVFRGETDEAQEQQLRVAAYDPRYILQFALHGLSEGCIDTEEFVCLGFLAVAITSLSSSEEGMRKLGYKILAKYFASLEEGSNFKGRPQIQMLLNYVKNAVTEEWQQLPYVLMLFAAESSCILMHPENPHYMTITRYLLKGPALDLAYVPLFHSMFGSGSPRYRSERLWMLRILACGLTSSRDSRVFEKQFVLELLMSFYNSPLADTFTRKWVLQVLLRASRIRGCVQALTERSGFLPWLASAAVNYMDLSTTEQDLKEADDLPTMVLQIMERVLSWKFMDQRGVGEGMAELTTAALTLRYFLTHCATTPKQWAIFRRPTIRIMMYVLRISQRRKKHETQFRLSLYDIVESIRWVESEGPDSGYGFQTSAETRLLALRMILQSSPPAILTSEDKQLMCKIASWAVPVANQAVLRQSTGGQSEFTKPLEPLPEKLTRWITASLVRGNLALYKSKLGEAKSSAKAFLSCLNSSDFHATNIELAIHLLRLQIHVTEEGCKSLVSALVMLWPLFEPEETLPGDVNRESVTASIACILTHIPKLQEADDSWRWSSNNAWRKKETAASGNPRFEAEMSHVALTLFQQLVVGQKSSGLARLVSQWGRGLGVPASSNDLLPALERHIQKLRTSH